METGEFTAKEEVRVMDKTFVTESIEGDFENFILEAQFFDDKLEVEMMVLDTDYDKYLIGYQCYDNMEFSLEEELEPVHMITLGIATRDPNTEASELTALEDKVLELLPFFKKEDFAKIMQGDEGQCDYKIEF